MSKFTTIVICLVIFALCVNLVIFFLGRVKTNPTPLISENNSREKKIEHVMLKQFEVEHRPLIISATLSNSLKEYMKSNTILVFYFDKLSCDPCTNIAIADLISHKETIGKQHILVLVAEDDQRQAMLLMSQVKDHFNTLWIKPSEIKFEGIDEHLPVHFFLLDQSLNPFCLYFFMPEFSAFNNEYFNMVAKRISQK